MIKAELFVCLLGMFLVSCSTLRGYVASAPDNSYSATHVTSPTDAIAADGVNDISITTPMNAAEQEALQDELNAIPLDNSTEW